VETFPNLTIGTERLQLRPLGDSDFPILQELSNRPAVREFLGSVANAAPVGAEVLLGIEERQHLIGVVGVFQSNALDGKDVELTCVLLEDFVIFEGSGFATEACQGVVEWARDRKPRPRILGCVHDHNARSQKLVRKLGMKVLGKRPSGTETVYTLDL
jgi:hypothetical protein